jgi:hypothetical protein
LFGRLGPIGREGWIVLVAGEAAALAVAGTVLAFAIAHQAGSADPEYGPLTLLLAVIAHATVGLTAALTEDHPGTRPAA